MKLEYIKIEKDYGGYIYSVREAGYVVTEIDEIDKDTYKVDGKRFKSLEDAKAHVERKLAGIPR